MLLLNNVALTTNVGYNKSRKLRKSFLLLEGIATRGQMGFELARLLAGYFLDLCWKHIRSSTIATSGAIATSIGPILSSTAAPPLPGSPQAACPSAGEKGMNREFRKRVPLVEQGKIG